MVWNKHSHLGEQYIIRRKIFKILITKKDQKSPVSGGQFCLSAGPTRGPFAPQYICWNMSWPHRPTQSWWPYYLTDMLIAKTLFYLGSQMFCIYHESPKGFICSTIQWNFCCAKCQATTQELRTFGLCYKHYTPILEKGHQKTVHNVSGTIGTAKYYSCW